jgi:hypothetical protein
MHASKTSVIISALVLLLLLLLFVSTSITPVIAEINTAQVELAADRPDIDVNQDGSENIFDLLELLNVLCGNKPATEYSDINDDNSTNIFDLLVMLQVLSGDYGKTTFRCNIKDMFSKEPIQRATVELLKLNWETVITDTTDIAYYEVKFDTTDDEYRLRVSADGSFTHITSKIPANKSKRMDISLVPLSFNMDAFDEGYRSRSFNFLNLTRRWKTPAEGGVQPKVYIDISGVIDNPHLETMKRYWTEKINEIVEAGRQADYVLFQDSVEIEFGTNPPARDEEGSMNYRYEIRNRTDWTLEDNEIKNAMGEVTGVMVDTAITKAIYIHEFARAIGFTGYVPNSQPSVGNAPAVFPHLNTFDKNSIIFLYSRPWGSKTPDTNP